MPKTLYMHRIRQQSLRSSASRVKHPEVIDKYTLMRSIAEESYYEFVKMMWSTVCQERFVDNWHIRYLCDEIQRCLERVFRWNPRLYDLIVNCPPGMSKSTICSILPVPWVWTRFPSFRFIGISHSHSLATRISRDARACVKSELYQKLWPHLKVRADQDAKSQFANNFGGERFAMSIESGVIGSHAHAIGIDDPINPKEALSELVLNTANDAIREVLTSRKVDKRVTVTWLIMQRLGVGDPTDVFLQRKKIRHICWPYKILEGTDNIKPPECKAYYTNGFFDPNRLDQEIANDIWDEMCNAPAFAAQYEQLPIPREGGQFKTDRIKYGIPPTTFKRGPVRYWDKAGTQEAGCFTAGVKMAIDNENRVWVLDVQHFQKDTFEREYLIKQTAHLDGKQVEIGQEVEPGSGGKESAQATTQRLLGFRVFSHKVGKGDGDKVNRAIPFSTQMNAGNVYLVEAPWNQKYVNELRHFGETSKYKDQVDASSGAFFMLTRIKIFGGLTGVARKHAMELP